MFNDSKIILLFVCQLIEKQNMMFHFTNKFLDKSADVFQAASWLHLYMIIILPLILKCGS